MCDVKNVNSFEALLFIHADPVFIKQIASLIREESSTQFFRMMIDLQKLEGRFTDVFCQIRRPMRDKYIYILQDIANKDII